jgi:hypothetical protein
MGASRSQPVSWKLIFLTCLATALLSLLPQIHLWLVHGEGWNGAYVSSQSDEPLYSAYVNALIQGRQRKNDPYGARDDSPESPLPESIFSIQFVPAYVIALPARMLGLSSATTFILLMPLAAILTSLSVFWLLSSISGDRRLGAAGTLVVLCFGGMSATVGLFGTWIDIPFPALLFLRRYQPSVAFPLLFVFQLLLWRALTDATKRGVVFSTFIAGVTLSLLIYSYLYLWTAAAAWLVCVGILWFYFRPADRSRTLQILAIVGAVSSLAFIPYAYLLSQRAAKIGEPQILLSTHYPDLWRIPEILGAVILVWLVVGVFRKRIDRTDPRVIFAVSLALLPFIVFNQQILTGKTMQAFHFESYVVGYSTMVALLITIVVFWHPLSQRFLIWITGFSLAWGLIAVGLPARSDSVPAALERDKTVPVFMRLKELSGSDGTVGNLRYGQPVLVFSPDVSLTKWLPTWTSQGTLLDQTGVDCGTATVEERKRFFYMHLYYSRVDAELLRQALAGTLRPHDKRLTAASTVIFGHARLFPELSSVFQPIRPEEIDREVNAYHAYINSFSADEARRRPIAYSVTAAEDNFDFVNLDRWYERDNGEPWGGFTLHRLRLRANVED